MAGKKKATNQSARDQRAAKRGKARASEETLVRSKPAKKVQIKVRAEPETLIRTKPKKKVEKKVLSRQGGWIGQKLHNDMTEKQRQRAVHKARIALGERNRAYDLKNKVEKTGKYQRAITWVKLVMHFKVLFFENGKEAGIRPRVEEDYRGIRWNRNNPRTWTDKMREWKAEMVEKVSHIMESGAEIVPGSIRFVKDLTMTKRQMNSVVSDPSKIPMLGRYDTFGVNGSDVIDYKFIPADLNKPTGGYTCTDSFLLEYYRDCKRAKKIKSLDQERLDLIMGKLNKKVGRSAHDLDKFCEEYGISHYALDWRSKVFFKEVRASYNYPALIYYCIDGHMYPVTHAATREHIIRKSAASIEKTTAGTNLAASMTEQKQEEAEAARVEMFTRNFYEDVALDELLKNEDKYHDCNVFYHTGNLKSLWMDLFKRTSTVYETKYITNKLIEIIMPERKMNLFANVNHSTSNPLKRVAVKPKEGVKAPKFKSAPYDWNDVMRECGAFRILFVNQSFTRLAQQVMSMFDFKGKKKHLRANLTEKQRWELYSECRGTCAGCKHEIKFNDVEVDHIKALWKGGDNSWGNLQILCSDCHDKKTKKEAAERAFDTDNTQSDFNEDVLEIFKTCKNGFINNFFSQEMIDTKMTLGQDICKTRANVMLYNKDPWMVFSVFDEVKLYDAGKYKNEIPVGVYRIVTNNYLPFKGTGWYSYGLVRKALAAKIITLKDVTHCVFPSFTLPANYYAPFVEYIRKYVDNPALAKLMINMYIGSLGHKITKSQTVFLTQSLNEASYHKLTAKEDLDFHVHVHRREIEIGEEDREMYEIVRVHERYCESNKVPIFNQILDEEAWLLYEITTLLKKHNCKHIMYVNTDNAVGQFTSIKDIEACKKEAASIFWDEEKQFPKYKEQTEINNNVRVEKDEHDQPLVEMLRTGQVKRPCKFIPHTYTQLYDDRGSMDFNGLVDSLINARQSCQIQGRAGTGKSYLIRQIMKRLDEKEIPWMAMCPTHKACRSLHAKAQTLHSRWAVMKNGGKDSFGRCEFVFIDEKSMILEQFWKCILQVIHRAKQQGKQISFIVCGDWDQLPPVGDRSGSFDYEQSKAMWEICGGRMVELTQCRRMDQSGKQLFEMCKDVSKVNFEAFPSKEYPLSVCYNNSVRKQINEMWMLQHRGKNFMLREQGARSA